jgi:hypothetical protein
MDLHPGELLITACAAPGSDPVQGALGPVQGACMGVRWRNDRGAAEVMTIILRVYGWRATGARRGAGRCVRAAAFVMILATVVGWAAGSASAATRVSVSLRAPSSVRALSLAVFSGTVRGGSGGATVAVQRRSGRKWRTLVSGRTSRHGGFALAWAVPRSSGSVALRAAVERSGRVAAVSGTRKVKLLKAKAGAVAPSARTQVLAASVISSVPAPGHSGVLRYSGGNDVDTGQIIAAGVGPGTPDGFLGQVTGVQHSGSQTIVSTRPASLMQAIPTGSLDAVLTSSSVHGSRDRAHAARVLGCKGSVTGSLTPIVSFNTSIALKGSWKLFGGLQSASLTANASANASLTAVIGAAGSCSLGPVTVLTFPGPAATFFVGPVPVVISSDLSVDVDAQASAQAAVTTGVSAGFSASAGIGWRKGSGFFPISTFSPHFTFTPPTLTASASVDANVTPGIDVLLYGVVGPQIALKAGLALDANIASNPWWTLTAPVALTASLQIPPLNLSSPDLTLYHHTFPIANAGGAHVGNGCTGSTCGGTPSVTITTPGNQTSTAGTPVSLQIQASDTDGGALTYTATGLPSGISINPNSGLISGTPTTPGSSIASVTATESSGTTGHVSFAWQVSAGGGGGGFVWSPSEPPLPAGAVNPPVDPPTGTFGLHSVSCPAVGSCVAVGDYTGTGSSKGGWIATLANGVWTSVPAPLPSAAAGSSSISLISVSCASSSFCAAAGYYLDSQGQTQALLETLQGGTWSATAPPLPALGVGSSAYVSAIDCPATGSCVAVGTALAATGPTPEVPFIESLSGGTWDYLVPPLPSSATGLGGGGLNAITCASVSSCIAVGFDNGNTGAGCCGSQQALIETLGSGSWSPSEPPLPAGASAGVPPLSEVACASAGTCVATTEGLTGYQAVLATLDNGTWTSTYMAVPASAAVSDSDVWDLACIPNAQCFANGTYYDPNGINFAPYTTVTDTYANGTWSPFVPFPSLGGLGGSMGPISCVASGFCVSIGDEYVGPPNVAPFSTTWSNGWTSPTYMPSPSGGQGAPEAVSCASSTFCVAVGNVYGGQFNGLVETGT